MARNHRILKYDDTLRIKLRSHHKDTLAQLASEKNMKLSTLVRRILEKSIVRRIAKDVEAKKQVKRDAIQQVELLIEEENSR